RHATQASRNSLLPFLIRSHHPLTTATLRRILGSTKTRDSVRFGGRSDEVWDEWHWRIAASGGIRFALRAAGRRLRRPRRRGSRFEYPHTQGEHLGLEACRATQGRGPPSRSIA